MACSPLSSRNLQEICAIVLLACLLVRSRVEANADYNLKGLLNTSNPEELEVKRSDFPSDFVFGVSTAATQIEGSANEEGRGPSVWDDFVKKYPGKISDRSNMSTSIDSYKRYKEDVKLLKALGVGSYRFSISWTRILPYGSLSGGVNQAGIDYYNNLINELVENGIKPYVTLFHFDSPQALQDKYGGFQSRSIVNDFKDYSKICFKAFGDRVKNWITINEPFIIAKFGYDLGVAAPGRCSQPYIAGPCTSGNSSTEPYLVSHNLLLAHATVVSLYRQQFQEKQRGEIGISLVGQYIEPYSNSPEDKAAAKRLMDFELGWYMEPLVYGDYPKSMKAMVKKRLPIFTKKEKKLVKGSFDFIGINYYTSRYGKSASPMKTPPRYTTDSLATEEDDLHPSYLALTKGCPKAENSGFIYIYPTGLQKLLEFMKKNYGDPKIYISENGINEANNNDRGLDVALNDPHRIINILRHLYRIRCAIKNGVNVKGYFYWSLFDDFEWGDGYTARFGLYYVDYKNNLNRIPKKSAKWFYNFLKGHDIHSSSTVSDGIKVPI